MPRDARDNMVALSATILETLKIIDTHGVPIGLVHEDGVLRGTVTDGDIRRGLLSGISLEDSVSRVMNASCVSAHAESSPADAAKIMRDHAIGHLPLVDANGQIVGLEVLKDFDPQPDGGNPVLIMAGGLGTRLQPLTDSLPKPLIEVGGRPILETIIEQFVSQGFPRIFLSVNYKAELIEGHFGDGKGFGAEISYVHEDKALGTGGALSVLPERPTSPLIVINGDVLTKVNFRHLIKFHENHDAPATMSVREYRFTVPFGVVETEDIALTAIAEKPEHTFFVNAGIYVLDPAVFDIIKRGEPIDMPDLFQRLLEAGKTPTVFPLREYWMDIGRLDDLDQAKREFAAAFSNTADEDQT